MHVRLLFGVYTEGSNRLIGTACSLPIRVLANYDAPVAKMSMTIKCDDDWEGWSREARLADGPVAYDHDVGPVWVTSGPHDDGEDTSDEEEDRTNMRSGSTKRKLEDQDVQHSLTEGITDISLHAWLEDQGIQSARQNALHLMLSKLTKDRNRANLWPRSHTTHTW
ncbi:hypothetical protein WJX84_000546 [Apatococcus fuscideae]|uniref:Uncharacterized protein n=1 Tax=Apatococcus fuscideae TaxID=2026836 RepID=A0AAW1T5A1_9CHLO